MTNHVRPPASAGYLRNSKCISGFCAKTIDIPQRGTTNGTTGALNRSRPGSNSYSADGRIRTDDPLFTKQLLCQLSYVGAAPRLYEGYEVATVVCAGSSGLMVIWLTGTLSLRNVVTKVLRVGSHHVIR